MCGIAGIVAYGSSAPPADLAELLRIRELMAVRGPDGTGHWMSADGRAGLAHRRLAIIDLSDSGAQPMSTPDGRLHVTFNGEIYNYQALRRELQSKGTHLASTSDTEVLLHLYREHGDAMVEFLRGMYAFAIWDDLEKTLFMARDPFGIKPLYYADSGGTVRFASQVKALIGGGQIDNAPEPAAHVGFFVLGSVPEPYTMYRSIRAVPAGSTLTLRAGGKPQIAKFFDVAREFALSAASIPVDDPRERTERLREALRDSVRHHMVADVPVGLFLSSGLDSSAVAGLACEVQGNNLHSVTLGFSEYRGTENDETPLAAATARSLGTVHETRWITREAFDEEFEGVLAAMDQPSIDGVNTYFVSKTASESGMKVALSGLGGDELFGGYPSFADVPRLVRAFAMFRHVPKAGRRFRKLAAPFLGTLVSPKYASLLEHGGTFAGAYLLRRGLYMPWELFRFMDPDFLSEGWNELNLLGRFAECSDGIAHGRQVVSALELAWYMRNQLLRDADWAGMAHSLEIRVPLVDVQLFRAVAPMLASQSPPTKADAARTPRTHLPERLFRRRKTGFSIPVHEWAKRERQARGPERHLRSWAQIVYRPYRKLRSLALLSDAFGGHGGIALYNRDLLTSLCAMPESSEVVAVPRLIDHPMQPLPRGLSYRVEAANSKWRYVKTVAKILASDTRFDLVVCCHINLFVIALIAKLRLRAPLMLFIYGIDAWRPQPAWKRVLLRKVDRFVSISDITQRKFQAWAGLRDESFTILPNAIHFDWYGPGTKSPKLVSRYGLHDKVVVMTLGRLVSSERLKGFDEVLDVMPSLVAEIPNLVYLIVGDGSDRHRLERKAAELGVTGHVRFAGLIPEDEKADHYRLADAYVMASRGEGFGFVLLEAMACGVPAVASRADGGREAIRDGSLGILVDPTNPEDVKRGIRDALKKGRGMPPQGLEFFYFDNFEHRTRSMVRETISLPRASAQIA